MASLKTKLEELKQDIAELELLQTQATRQKVKDILSIEARKLTSEVINLNDRLNNEPSTTTSNSASVSSNLSKCYQVKLNNYAWDQSNKFVKFYVTLKNVHTVPEENVHCTFKERSLELNVKNLENKDYVFVINNLLKKINIEGCTWKIKTDMVLINAAKVEPSDWSHVTELEKKSSDSKKMDTNEKSGDDDPADGIMSLMKKMYDQGDDEMKRTIAKAWTESQQNKNPGFPQMPQM